MKTTVRNLMMSLVLMGGMILAVPVSAQHSSSRQRPSAARGASVSAQSRTSSSESRQSVSRSDNRQSSTRSSQGSVRSRGSESSRMSTSSSARVERSTPQVSRTERKVSQSSTRTERKVSQPSTRSTQQVQSRVTDRTRSTGTDVKRDRGVSTRSTAGSVQNNRERPSTQIYRNGTGDRFNHGTNDNNSRGGQNGNTDNGRGNSHNGNGNGNMDNGHGNGHNGNGNGNMDNGRGNGHNGNGNMDNGRGNGRNGRNGNGRGYDNRGNFDNGRGHGGNQGYGPRDRNGHSRPYNYSNHPHRDHFSWNYSHHNWGRPLPPPYRAYRPAPLRYYRPVIPAHYRPYYGAPVIDRILGITFGTLFDATLDYLYGSGYYIDGYENNIIYLRDVSMLNLLWPDVMLCYDSGRLANAQFVYMTNYLDRSRYNRIYHDLSAVYGPPISVESGLATWYGGNTTGYVTLSLGSDYGRYYTTLSVGY